MRYVLFLLLFATGCASSYAPKLFSTGYGETPLVLPTALKGFVGYRVSFRGNGHTSMDRASDFALLRACDLAIAHGAPNFVIYRNGSRLDSDSYYVPPVVNTYQTGQAYGLGSSNGRGLYSGSGDYVGQSTTIVSGGYSNTITRPEAEIDILLVMTCNPFVGKNIQCFDVHDTKRQIQVKYGMD